jgi:WD40 repeat protein
MYPPSAPPAAQSGANPAKLIAELKGHTDAVTALAFSADRCLLATTGRDGSARLWNVASSKPGERATLRKSGETFRSLAFSPNSRTLAAGAATESGLIWLFDVSEKTPQETTTLRGARGAVEALGFSPDNKLVAGAGEDQTLRIWEPGPASRGDARALLPGHSKPIAAVAFAPDGTSAATAGRDSTVRLWGISRIRSSVRAIVPHPGEVVALAFTPDGKTLATACRDGAVRLWDVSAIKPVVRTELTGIKGGVRLLLVPDAGTLVGVGDGTRVFHWDLRNGKLAREWEVPGDPATGVAITSDGRYLARGMPSGTVELYRVADKRA